MTGRPLITKTQRLPRRIAGNVALDLANTMSWRGTAQEIDHLGGAEAITAWATDAGIVSDTFSVPASNRAMFVAEIHRLRHAIEAVFADVSRGATPKGVALRTILDFVAGSIEAATLRGVPTVFEFQGLHRITGPLAWAALDLLRSSSELARLKQCPPADCRWLFLDYTKNSSRRWCDMATCGDRAKKLARR
jgi:predicted RNA-binding Zn ribbon-like protein